MNVTVKVLQIKKITKMKRILTEFVVTPNTCYSVQIA